MSYLLILHKVRHFLCLAGCLTLVACGGYASTLSDADRALFEQFTEVDVASVDEKGFSDLISLRKELTSGTAAMSMSAEETEKATLQIEAMIARLTSELATITDKKVKKTKGRDLYDLKKAIGRGGA
ncbi:hypothetical protein N8633_00465 [bacterium]|jgi:hypothetical protein|nr:hypothetical protein [Verrucomicrobiota bacterium]MDA7680237.1 hypothetical protein [bacterium]